MRFGGKVYDGVDLMPGEQFLDETGIADVAVDKNVAGVAGEICQIGRIARVGELVKIDELRRERVVVSEALTDEIGADKAATAGDE